MLNFTKKLETFFVLSDFDDICKLPNNHLKECLNQSVKQAAFIDNFFILWYNLFVNLLLNLKESEKNC